ncbi:MAG: tetratricopeptide repeat protein [Acidobacteria bacterium]|nr:tetratricopeptide repeat protein [Acidobacteriota bacterium]
MNPETSQARPIRFLLPTILLAIPLLALPALIQYIPDNHRGIYSEDGETLGFLDPGFHLRPIGLEPRAAIYPLQPIRLRESAVVQTREGFQIQTKFSFTARILPANLEEFHRRRGNLEVVEAIREAARISLRNAASGVATHVLFGTDPASSLNRRFASAMRKQALTSLELEVVPQDLQTAFRIEEKFLRRHLTAGARQLLETVLPRFARSPELYVKLGNLYSIMGDPSHAEEQYLAALYLDLSLKEPMEWLLARFLKTRDLDRAEGILEAARDKVPESAEHRIWLASVYMFKGNYVGAEQEIVEGLKSHPDDSALRVNLAGIKIAQEDYQEAAGILGNLVADHPDLMNARFNLGIALNELGKTEEALEEFRKLEKAGQSEPELFNQMGKVLKETGRPDDAAEYFRKSLEIRADQPEIRELLADGDPELPD